MMISGLFTTVADVLLYDYLRPKELYGVVVAMVLILLNMSHSGSALARSFWVNIPVIIMYVGVMVALDNAWVMVAMIAFLVIVDIPEQFLRHVDTA